MKSRGVALSNFTIGEFTGYLNSKGSRHEIACDEAPFDSVFPVLYDDASLYWVDYDFMVLWTTPAVIGAYARMMAFETVEVEEILQQTRDYAAAIIARSKHFKHIFVPSWSLPEWVRGYGIADMQMNKGLRNVLMQMNLLLAEAFTVCDNVFFMDVSSWTSRVINAYSPKTWYMGKIPFKSKVFLYAVEDILAAMDTFAGMARKLIVLDLDNTLWGGVVGDDGWENIRLGGTDFIGEAFKDFQRVLRGLKNRGIILALASKNEESVAMEAIDKHPEMVLRRSDFAMWRINWNDKAENIASMVKALNIGLQSVVFIDDSAIERARVEEALPEVLVPDWPKDVTAYASTLMSMPCFDALAVSSEDLKRTEMYIAEQQRTQQFSDAPSADEWLRQLDLKVFAESYSDVNAERTVQLLNKTNQMNLTTRRLNRAQLEQWLAVDGRELWVYHVEDKYGQYGLTAIASMEVIGDKALITDFIMSCRVMSRQVENAVLHHLSVVARAKGVKNMVAHYLPTAKNRPLLRFLQNSRFTDEPDHCFAVDLSHGWPVPDFITLTIR